MRAGDLRRRIQFQQRVVTLDTSGQQIANWIDVLTNVPANIEPLSGRELIAAQAVNAEVSHRITVRYHPALANPVTTASMRVIYQAAAGVTRYFNLASAMNSDERNRTIEIMANEGLNQG